LGSQLEKILAIDTTPTYRGKTVGPRIRVLVRDVETLPTTILIPGAKEGMLLEYKVVYQGRPDQCLRCKAIGHLVRNCPWPKKRGTEKEKGTGTGIETRGRT
jgi:hypothetical protein